MEVLVRQGLGQNFLVVVYEVAAFCHGVAAFDFATVSGCDQLVVGPTHARGGTLDLLMTDFP